MELKGIVLSILLAGAGISLAVSLLLGRSRGKLTDKDIAEHLDRIEQKVAVHGQDDNGRAS